MRHQYKEESEVDLSRLLKLAGDQFREEPHPLYPLGGPHWLSGWHSYNDGHRFIVARQRASVERIAVIDAKSKHETPEGFDELKYVNIVDPPPALVERVCLKKFRDHLIVGLGHVDYLASSSSLPGEFRRCRTCAKQRVHSCPFCLGSGLVASERVLLRLMRRWPCLPRHRARRDGLPDAHCDVPLYVAWENHGSKRRFPPYDLIEDSDFIFSRPLFFFQFIGTQNYGPPREAQEIVEKRDAKLKKEHELADKKRNEEWRREPIRRSSELRALLDPLPEELALLSVLRQRGGCA